MEAGVENGLKFRAAFCPLDERLYKALGALPCCPSHHTLLSLASNLVLLSKSLCSSATAEWVLNLNLTSPATNPESHCSRTSRYSLAHTELWLRASSEARLSLCLSISYFYLEGHHHSEENKGTPNMNIFT